jgi:hypothetical protein
MSPQLISRLWILAALLVWGGVIIGFGMVRFDTFGLDEGAAMGLLLNWSVSDQIASPVTTFGGPDLRALLFIPLGLYWSGSMLAAKVFTLLVTFGAALLTGKWYRQYHEEAALIATGLLLVAPVTLLEADSMGVGPYLLALFGLGWLLDKKYRASPHRISSLYFVQTLLVAITVTLHPMGLAYPLALAWHWYQNPKSARQRQQVWAGLAIATAIVLAMGLGWIAIHWFGNPLTALGNAVLGERGGDASDWLPGLIPAALLAVTIVMAGRRLLGDVMGTTLLLACLIGLLVGDTGWAFIALAVLFYSGVPLLIQANTAMGQKAGFVGQRGLVLLVMFIIATVFMQADRAHREQVASNQLSPSDEVIQALASEAADKDKPFLAASQWPARTMIACRRDVLPLPPATADGPTLLKSIKGITHVMFDHHDPDNAALAKNFSEITDATQTLAILPGGVIIKVRAAADHPPKAATPAAPVKGDSPALPKP